MLVFSCKDAPTLDKKAASKTEDTNDFKFERVSSKTSGISFVNAIDEFNSDINYFSYYHIYHGSGVAAGDLNNDGLPDLVFQSSWNGPQVYQNKGDFKFEAIPIDDATLGAYGVGNGVTLVDINNDNLLDIYLCYAGSTTMPKALKTNKLLINQGDFKFIESAKDYGLDNSENSAQAAFFDYDKDGDLDMYLVNTNTERYFTSRFSKLDVFKFGHPLLDQLGAQDRLYMNNGNGTFKDMTSKSGLVPELFYGFNASIGDYNADGWPDVYVSNDFHNPDFLYINNQNGTFSESALSYFGHTSYNSMGSDAADINNDGIDDLVVLDMSPEDYKRSRRNMGMIDVNFTAEMDRRGYGKQYMHNVLHLNTGKSKFQEIGQFAGIHKTDWSWAILNDDFDNDGYKDMYITNGMYRDINDFDAFNARKSFINSKQGKIAPEDIKNIVNQMPSVPLVNYLFKNNGDLSYTDITTEAGVAIPSFSQGAVTVDLDNDGDLDIVTNNTNEEALVFENKSSNSKYIQFTFEGPAANKQGLGAQICVTSASNYQCQTLYVSRGYYSSTDYKLHFGLGEDSITSVKVTWPDGYVETIKNPRPNQILNLNYSNAKADNTTILKPDNIFEEQFNHKLKRHKDNAYNDYQHQLLLPHKLSELGPALATADVNGDGLEDVFIGSATNEVSQIYIQKIDGSFSLKTQQSFIIDSITEDTAAEFFDFDQDGDQDLFVVSGSYEFKAGSEALTDRLYINDGKGNFSSFNYGEPIQSNAMSITSGDIDNDGDLDLFIGGRVIHGQYPYTPKSYLLINQNNLLIDKTDQLAPELRTAGMVTDAQFFDIDADNDADLIIVGEWMPVTFFSNRDGQLSKQDTPLDNTSAGWWNTIKLSDLNSDGQMDVVLGNLGLNYKFSASTKKPLEVYCEDFDNNGSYDIVLAKPLSDIMVPVRGKMCSSEQMPFLKEKFPSFESFANATLVDLYGDEGLEDAFNLQAVKFESCILLNQGDFNFKLVDLPREAQIAPINSIITNDFNDDGITDLLVAGNLYQSEVETTRADAGMGLLLFGNGDGGFTSKTVLDTGFFADGDVRHLKLINDKVIVVRNNDKASIFNIIE